MTTAPTATPPAATGNGTAAGTLPSRLAPSDDVALVTSVVPDTAGPTLLPPQQTASASAATSASDGVTAAVWTYDKTVSATWCVNETRNAWMLVDGVGWKKIFNGTDGAFTALVTLAAQARQTGHRISFREDGGLVREIYLW